MKTFLFFVLLCLGTGSVCAQPQPEQKIAARAGLEQKIDGQLPLDTQFRDEHGRLVRLGDFFHAKPVVFAFVYYECPNLCTLVLNGTLQTAHELRFDAGKDYEIVIVSFDARERPALAAAKKEIYAQEYDRPHGRDGWHFLTGDSANITRLAESVGYHFAYDETTRQFAHPSTIVVATPTGKISRYFPGIEYPPRDVRLALIAASQNQIGSVTDQIFLLCFHYNPNTGKYGLVISRVIQVAGMGTVALLAASIAWMVRRERTAAL